MNLLHLSAVFTISAVLLLSFSFISGEKTTLYCYQCIKLNCEAELDICKDVRSFIAHSLQKYYDLPSTIPNCPESDDAAQWSLLQLDTNACPNKDSVCAVERIEVLTSLNEYGTRTVKSSASVLGCASQDLKSRMKEHYYGCNITKPEGIFRYPNIKHFTRMEHCDSPSTECNSRDWCVEPSNSEIKAFTTVDPSKTRSSALKLTIIIGIGVLFAILFLAWGACHFCNLATYRTSYVPKSGLEDTDSVIVVKNKTNSRREYEQPETVAHKRDEEGVTILNEDS